MKYFFCISCKSRQKLMQKIDYPLDALFFGVVASIAFVAFHDAAF